jgi:CheY-like chemotaxis protein
MSHERNSQFKLLFAVDETFDITGRGLVVASGPNARLEPQTLFHNGAEVSLKRPDGTIIENKAYLEISTPNKRKIFALSLPGLTVADVPRGTEVWAAQHGAVELSAPIPVVFESSEPKLYQRPYTRMRFKGRVLIVESDERLRKRISDLFRSSSKVHACGSGKEALRVLKQSDMDLVLLDVKLPDLSGAAVFEKYRQAGGKAIVLLLNGRSATLMHEPGEQICVPIDIADLVAEVSALLAK